jgi:4'-phosphopantetheinyl transferase EntD
MSAVEVVPSSRWRALLPQGVVTCETRRFDHSSCLYPQERLAVRDAVAKRVEEFAAGRVCARAALAQLGIADAPLLRGPDRRPVWPSGVVGSITHTDRYCAAAVARSSAFLGIGIDVERVGRLTRDVQQRICSPRELDRLGAMDDGARQDAATVIFSAKEAFYKSQSGLDGAMSDFLDVELRLHEGVFVVEPRRPLAAGLDRAGVLSGRYVVDSGLVFTGIALPVG